MDILYRRVERNTETIFNSHSSISDLGEAEDLSRSSQVERRNMLLDDASCEELWPLFLTDIKRFSSNSVLEVYGSVKTGGSVFGGDWERKSIKLLFCKILWIYFSSINFGCTIKLFHNLVVKTAPQFI